MPPRKATGPKQDSMRANPRAGQLLAWLLDNGTITHSTEPREIYQDPRFSSTFAPVDYEKYRKKFRTEQAAKWAKPNDCK